MPIQQRAQSLPQIPASEDPSAVAQNHREDMHLYPLLSQPHPGRTPVHLSLLARNGLEAHRRSLLAPLLLPPRPQVARQRRVRSLIALRLQLPVKHRGVETHLRRPPPQKVLPPIQCPAATRPPLPLPLLTKPLAHRLDVQTELPTDLLFAQAPLA